MLKLIKSQKGFTLVELMVVILIIAILIAVAIPVFLGVRGRAQDNVANQAMTNASRAVAAEYTAVSPNALPNLATMNGNEPSYTWQGGASTDDTQVQYTTNTDPTGDGTNDGVVSVKSDRGAFFATATVSGANGTVTTNPL